MNVEALVAITETENYYPITFHNEPKLGDTVTLHVDGKDGEYEIIDILPTGFSGSPPYLYGVCVKPK